MITQVVKSCMIAWLPICKQCLCTEIFENQLSDTNSLLLTPSAAYVLAYDNIIGVYGSCNFKPLKHISCFPVLGFVG